MNLFSCFVKLSVQTFQPIIVIYIRGNFVCHHLGCTLIYRPSSYPFRVSSTIPEIFKTYIRLKCKLTYFNILISISENLYLKLYIRNISNNYTCYINVLGLTVCLTLHKLFVLFFLELNELYQGGLSFFLGSGPPKFNGGGGESSLFPRWSSLLFVCR